MKRPVNCLIAVVSIVCLLATQPLLADNYVTLTPKLSRELRTFLTPLVEVGLKPFRRGALTNSEMIRFGVYYSAIHEEKRFISADQSRGKIAARFVDDVIHRYFGPRAIHRASMGRDITYANGYYFTSLGAGEPTKFADVMQLHALGHNTYRVFMYEYEAPNTWDGNINDRRTWDTGNDAPKVQRQYNAVVHRLNGAGTRMELLALEEVPWD